MANLVRVLEATLKGPRRSSQRPTNPRPHTDQGGTASAGDRTDFQPGTGRPTGGTETNPMTRSVKVSGYQSTQSVNYG
jgi:hypothetical protein